MKERKDNLYKKVYVEITNICNLSCPFCIKNNRPQQIMDEKSFEKVLEKLQPHTKYLYFHLLGEPLMHPKINEFIDKASVNFSVNITTNGYLIHKIKDNKNIRQVNISLHSFDEIYGKTLEEYLTNIMSTVDILKESTYISLRLWAYNKNFDKIIEFLEKKYQKKLETNKKVERQTLEKNVYLNYEQEFEWPDLENNFEKETGGCRALKDHIGILVDGTIVPCCLDSKGNIKLGNIYEDDLEKIQKGKRYQEMLTGFQNQKRVEPLCKKCNFR